jgi:hypothetical protein
MQFMSAHASRPPAALASNTKPRRKIPGRTQATVDALVQQYLDERTVVFEFLKARAKGGGRQVLKEAEKLFGRNHMATALDVPRAMVSKTSGWKLISTAFPRPARLAKSNHSAGNKTSGPARSKEDSPDEAAEIREFDGNWRLLSDKQRRQFTADFKSKKLSLPELEETVAKAARRASTGRHGAP